MNNESYFDVDNEYYEEFEDDFDLQHEIEKWKIFTKMFSLLFRKHRNYLNEEFEELNQRNT